MTVVTAQRHDRNSRRYGSFDASRAGQFVLAFLCETSAQKGILWWAAKHRHHHKHSDTVVHSPRRFGFLFSHVDWIFARQRGEADYTLVRDLSRFPNCVS